MQEQKLPITAIVPTKNEELNIEECLKSLNGIEKVYVVDSFSTDRTGEIAREYGAEVISFRYDGTWPKKKNWAIRNLEIETPWVMIIDADERLTDELVDELSGVIQRRDVYGIYVRWKFIFLGKWMKHCWNHGWMLRIFRYGHGEYENLGMTNEGGWDNEVHENIQVEGKCIKVNNYLIHETNQSLSYWINKQNQFSDWNSARRLQERNTRFNPRVLIAKGSDPAVKRKELKKLYLKMPMKPLLMFLYLYIIQKGLLDGREGLYFCLLRASHELNTQAKIFEVTKSRRN